MAKYIDVTPTWLGLLPAIVQLVQATKTRASAMTELRRMATAADKWNDHCRQADVAPAEGEAQERAPHETKPVGFITREGGEVGIGIAVGVTAETKLPVALGDVGWHQKAMRKYRDDMLMRLEEQHRSRNDDNFILKGFNAEQLARVDEFIRSFNERHGI